MNIRARHVALLAVLAGLVALLMTGERPGAESGVTRSSPAPGSSAVTSEPGTSAAGMTAMAETADRIARGAGEKAMGGEAVETGAGPRSRLLRSLGERAAAGDSAFSQSGSGTGDTGDIDGRVSGIEGTLGGGVLSGCPRALLSALLAGAAETGDAVSALAIERETLALCRERQEIVNGIVTLENELGALRAERLAAAASPVALGNAQIVKDTPPVTVVRRLEPSQAPDDAAEPETTGEPARPTYSWFSIIGTAGDLRAGIGDGARVWFVREGDRLPGGVAIERIDTRPPGVRIGGEEAAALPYRPRAEGAVAGGTAGGGGP